jgi:hypothetical protein
LDDGTFEAQPLDGATFQLLTPNGFVSLNEASGLMTTSALLIPQTVTLQVTRGAISDTLNVTVLNSIKDNYSTYADDGLDDDWQVRYFGLDNPDARPTVDNENDTHNNFTEFALDLNPLIASSFPFSGRRVGGDLEYHYQRSKEAMALGITYVVEWSETLSPTSWVSTGVVETILLDDGTKQRVVAKIPAGTAGRRFARLVVKPRPVPTP